MKGILISPNESLPFPIMKIKATKLFKEFFESEKSGGLSLIACTIVSLLVANSVFGASVLAGFHWKIMGLSIEHWVNDGLMTIYFLLVGLELERELYQGELSVSPKQTILPIAGAIGGMLLPAGIHACLNWGTPQVRGAGIPMATDIAFSLGILSLFSSRVPLALKVFLTALAIADDLGAIVVIATFYTKELHLNYLFAGLAIFAIMCTLNRMRVWSLLPYLSGGVLMWWCFLNSGVHATISGVMLAFAIPFGTGKEDSPSYVLQHRLHLPVSLGILPVFALVNTCIPISDQWREQLTSSNSLGIILGLVLGKLFGILLFAYAVVRFGLSELPEEVSWRHMAGAAFLAGIGFTMSIFVSLLAFEGQPDLINASQLSVLIASLIAAVSGAIWFLTAVPKMESISTATN
jgi:NhaA family Na+:H+ antiporter